MIKRSTAEKYSRRSCLQKNVCVRAGVVEVPKYPLVAVKNKSGLVKL